MSNTFEILMDQLDMPLEMRSSSAFLHAEIQEVVVHKVSRVWEFRFAFAEILPITLFKELRQRLKDEFSKTGNQATFTIQVANQDFSADLLRAYYREVFEEGPCASQGFKGLYQDLQVRAEGQELIISGPSSVDTEHFRKNHLPNLAKQLEAFGFPHFTCRVESDEELTEQEVARFEEEMKRFSKQPMKRPCGLLESLVQMAPLTAVEENPVFDFKAKKAVAKPKLDKAEITPMIEITTEENRIVFEGVVFDVEHKVTRTGRVLISFKMTDYTSSFPFRNGLKMRKKPRSLT